MRNPTYYVTKKRKNAKRLRRKAEYRKEPNRRPISRAPNLNLDGEQLIFEYYQLPFVRWHERLEGDFQTC